MCVRVGVHVCVRVGVYVCVLGWVFMYVCVILILPVSTICD